MPIRWGIVSAGKISQDFARSLGALPKANHQIVAIGARALASAEQFAKLFNIPKAYEGYEKLAEDAEVDIVYVGALNPQHYEVSKMMLEHGKHVLCEKPMTINEKQTRALMNLAKSKNLFIAEAIWSRSFPAYAELRKLLDNKAIGDVLQVYVTFGFDLRNIPRLKLKEMGGGTILDLGIYVLQLQQFVFRGLKPSKVWATGILNSEGTDDTVSAVIVYPEGQTALISTSALAACPNEAIITGTKGIIRIPEFWCPTKLIVKEKTLDFPLPEISGEFNFHNSVGLSYQAEVARQSILAGVKENANITHEESIALAGLMDNLRQQVGVIFDEDSQKFE